MLGIVAELKELLALQSELYAVETFQSQKKWERTGLHHTMVKGQGMEFAESRHYQSGDEIRHMDWRVTARTGKPYIKCYQEEKAFPVYLCCDFSPSMYFGTRVAFKSVIAARLAALIAWKAISEDDKVGGIFASTQGFCQLPPRSRQGGLFPLLGKLSEFTKQVVSTTSVAIAPPQIDLLNDATRLNEMLHRLKSTTRSGDLIVLISDFYHLNEEGIKQLRRLRLSHQLVAYMISDPLELAPPSPSARYPMCSGKDHFLLDSRNKQIVDAYQSYCDERIKRLNNLFKSLSVPFFQALTHTALPAFLGKTFPRRSYAY